MSVDLSKGATVELVKTLSDDLRTKNDGTKHSSAGEGMRALESETSDLKTAIDYYEPVNWFNANDTEPYNDTFVYSNYIPAKLNDSFAFYWSSDPSNLTHGTPRNWMYYDKNKNKLGETATWTQDYTVTSGSVAYIRAVLNIAHVNAYAMIEKNQNPAITIYSGYFAPHYVANDSIARAEISNTEALIFDETSTIKGTYTKGTISQGNYIYVSYRVAETELLSFPCTKTIYIKDGFRVGFHCFKDGVFAYDSGWKTGFYYIPKGYQFKFVIARVNESSSEVIADINEFINAIYYKTDLINDRNTVNQCLMSIAHQGFSTTRSYYGDSRISSYIGAAQHGFECAETDIQFASDGVPVCCHDPSFTDATSGNTITIADHTAAELKTYDYFGETISTLEEVISTCKTYGLKLELDKVNSGWTEANWDAVFELVTKYQMQKYVIWTCPNPTCADKILAYDSHAVLMMNTSAQYLSGTIITAKTIATETNTVIVACNYNGLAVNDLITCNQQIGNDNIHIAVWTIDDIATYKQFMPYVWAITSNKLKAADVI